MNRLVIWTGNAELNIFQSVQMRTAEKSTDWGLVSELEDLLRTALAAEARPALKVVAG